MGKKRIASVDLSQDKPQPKVDPALRETVTPPESPDTPKPPAVKPKREHHRSRKYRQALTKIDRTKNYPLSQAIGLLKQVSLAKFDSSVEAHLNLTETGVKVKVQFPHSTGRSLRIAIADDKLIKEIQSSKWRANFDVLLATPELMPQVAKVAKILGPRGLMPNPKAGTVTTDPHKKKQELETGKTIVSGEPKAPLMHIVVGKISLSDDQLIANITALVSAITLRRITKLTLAPTMGPGIKVDLASLDQKQ